MPISIVRLGTPRKKKDLRLGTVRRPPRGVKKEDFSRLDYYDVWLPILSPKPELLKLKNWKTFARRFKAQMKKTEPESVLNMLAELSHQSALSIGCYCEDESRCHRSLLREILLEKGAVIN